jgi:hypothetical protein
MQNLDGGGGRLDSRLGGRRGITRITEVVVAGSLKG